MPKGATSAGEDTRDPRAAAITEADMPDFMSQSEAEDALSGSLDIILGLGGAGETDDEDGSNDDQGGKRQSRDADETDEDDQRRDAESDDDEDETGDEDEDETGDEDQGDDDQSEDRDGDDDADEVFSVNENGEYEPQDLEAVMTMEIEGEQVSNTLAEWRDGFMRHRDYTLKTQQLASRVAQEVEQGVQEQRQALEERGQTLEGLVQLFDGLVPKEPSFEALQRQTGNAEQAAKIYDQQIRLRKQITAAGNEAKRLKLESGKREQDSMITQARRTLALVAETDPRWKGTKGDEQIKGLQQYLGDLGLGDDDLVAILQKPAFVTIATDAMLGSAVKERKKDIKKKLKKTPTKKRQASARKRPTDRQRQGHRAQLQQRVQQGGESEALKIIESMI